MTIVQASSVDEVDRLQGDGTIPFLENRPLDENTCSDWPRRDPRCQIYWSLGV